MDAARLGTQHVVGGAWAAAAFARGSDRRQGNADIIIVGGDRGGDGDEGDGSSEPLEEDPLGEDGGEREGEEGDGEDAIERGREVEAEGFDAASVIEVGVEVDAECFALGVDEAGFRERIGDAAQRGLGGGEGLVVGSRAETAGIEDGGGPDDKGDGDEPAAEGQVGERREKDRSAPEERDEAESEEGDGGDRDGRDEGVQIRDHRGVSPEVLAVATGVVEGNSRPLEKTDEVSSRQLVVVAGGPRPRSSAATTTALASC